MPHYLPSATNTVRHKLQDGRDMNLGQVSSAILRLAPGWYKIPTLDTHTTSLISKIVQLSLAQCLNFSQLLLTS